MIRIYACVCIYVSPLAGAEDFGIRADCEGAGMCGLGWIVKDVVEIGKRETFVKRKIECQ